MQNKTERVYRINIPIVSEFEHIILKIKVITGIRVVLNRLFGAYFRYRSAGLEIHVILGINLRELAEGIGLFSAIIEVKRDHFVIQPAFDVAEIHTAIPRRKHSVEAFHHVAFGLDIDDTTLP